VGCGAGDEARQRFAAEFSPDGGTISGRWETSRNGSSWEHDFDLTYRKVQVAGSTSLSRGLPAAAKRPIRRSRGRRPCLPFAGSMLSRGEASRYSQTVGRQPQAKRCSAATLVG
jgi:hypothetical protein